jgi:hypothetical protein
MDISREEALTLLAATSDNNRAAGGRIGGPWAYEGYSRENALTIASRCTDFQRIRWQRMDAVRAMLPGYGDHVWYLNLQAPKDNPWG